MKLAGSPETPPAAYKAVDIDPDGDLYLDVSNDETSTVWRFRVCSAALRRRSPVWKQMLFGPWKESKRANSVEDWIVEFPEDSPSAMRLILHIIHGNFDMVPPLFLSLSQLYDLLVVANKYDVVNIIKPWTQNWATIAQGSGSMMEPEDIVRSFYIAWQMGDENLFIRRLQEIAVHSSTDATGCLVLEKDVSGQIDQGRADYLLENVEHLGPQDILETISLIRAELLGSIIQPVQDDLQARVKDSPVCSFKPSPNSTDRDAGSAQLCDSAILGGIHSAMLKRRGLMLPKEHMVISDSVVGLATWLFPLMTAVETIPRHQKTCSIAQKYIDLSNRVHGSIPTVTEYYMKHIYKSYMEKARVKTGLTKKGLDTRTDSYWVMPSLPQSLPSSSTPALSSSTAPPPPIPNSTPGWGSFAFPPPTGFYNAPYGQPRPGRLVHFTFPGQGQ